MEEKEIEALEQIRAINDGLEAEQEKENVKKRRKKGFLKKDPSASKQIQIDHMTVIDKDTYRTLQMSLENVDSKEDETDGEENGFLPNISGKKKGKMAKILSTLHEGDE